jgi:hypothetical protein
MVRVILLWSPLIEPMVGGYGLSICSKMNPSTRTWLPSSSTRLS